jgi:hypothetical protein
VKLSSIPLIILLTACSTPPSQPVVERLDPDTATTLAVIKKPVELLIVQTAPPADRDTGRNPFAFLAPFETNRMGQRALYLWVSVPSVEGGTKLQPILLCDGQPVSLKPIDGDLTHIGLSNAPYPSPVPWNAQWYYQLPQDILARLAAANEVTLDAHGSRGEPEKFAVESKDLTELKAFNSH